MQKKLHTHLETYAATQVRDTNLWKRILEQNAAEQRAARLRRTSAVIFRAATVMVLLAIFITVSPLKTYAQALLHRIGGITFTSHPVNDQEEMVSGDMDAMQSWTVPNLSFEEVQAQYGATVRVAQYIPQGFSLEWQDASAPGSAIRSATLHYKNAAGDDFLSVEQSMHPEGLPAPLGEWNVGDASLEDVTVRGLPGKFVRGAPIIATQAGHRSANILAWEEEGATFSLTSEKLSLNTLLLIAESLR